jgi:hypothetical protein
LPSERGEGQSAQVLLRKCWREKNTDGRRISSRVSRDNFCDNLRFFISVIISVKVRKG